MASIWCIRPKRKSIERREAKFRSLERIWRGDDFRIWGIKDLVGLRRNKPDVLIVFGNEASRAVRNVGLKGRFNVYVPSFWRKRLHLDLTEVASRHYDLILPDEVYWIDDFRKVHPRVHLVDRGFDPKVFRPDPRAKKRWDIAFVGNTETLGRQKQLDALIRFFGKDRVLIQWGLDHAPYARILQQSRIGWNQILSVENRSGLNYRVWEVLGAGALLLVNKTADLAARLRDRKHVVFWHSRGEMLELADYYIRRWDDRGARIAKAGCELAHSKHTWDHRARQYLEIIRTFL